MSEGVSVGDSKVRVGGKHASLPTLTANDQTHVDKISSHKHGSNVKK